MTSKTSSPRSVAERIVVLLPLSANTAAQLMLAVGERWPGSVIADPTDDERSRVQGEFIVMELPDG